MDNPYIICTNRTWHLVHFQQCHSFCEWVARKVANHRSRIVRFVAPHHHNTLPVVEEVAEEELEVEVELKPVKAELQEWSRFDDT
jgi:hypothetical protein